jgi:Trk K+ transport system NAD-binding subunit
VLINPPMDTVIADGDEILVIAEDDLLISLRPPPGADA